MLSFWEKVKEWGLTIGFIITLPLIGILWFLYNFQYNKNVKRREKDADATIRTGKEQRKNENFMFGIDIPKLIADSNRMLGKKGGKRVPPKNTKGQRDPGSKR